MRECGKVLVWLRQAQSPGFVNYVRSPLVCAQSPGFGKFSHRTSTTLSHRGGKFFIVISALESQRRVRCEFGVVCFLEIDNTLRKIN